MLSNSTPMALQIPSMTSANLTIFSDASWQDCPDTGRSTVGYMIFYNGALIEANSTMPTPVAMSTSEAEYMAAYSATMATAHIRMLLYDMLYLGTKQWRESTERLPSIPAILMIDNEATVQIAKNGKLTRKTRHIERASTSSVKASKTAFTNFIGSPVTPNLPIFLPKLNTPAKSILTSPRSSVFSLTTCFHHRDQRSDPRGVLGIYRHSVTLSLVLL
ncbi:hypothetical protein MHU86_23614 [Fragilaria crotonensis]|nr:hypothetical protein MHU86_23614 [Fragilaria crotonensis]